MGIDYYFQVPNTQKYVWLVHFEHREMCFTPILPILQQLFGFYCIFYKNIVVIIEKMLKMWGS